MYTATRKLTESFWYRHGVKLIVAVLIALCYLAWGISLSLDDNVSVRDSKVSFLEYRCDKQANEILYLKRKISQLEDAVNNLHGAKDVLK
jgi:cell division protein FtsB